MARTRRLHRSGSFGLRSSILKRHPNLRILCLRWSRDDSLLALSAPHAGESGGGHVVQKQGRPVGAAVAKARHEHDGWTCARNAIGQRSAIDRDHQHCHVANCLGWADKNMDPALLSNSHAFA